MSAQRVDAVDLGLLAVLASAPWLGPAGWARAGLAVAALVVFVVVARPTWRGLQPLFSVLVLLGQAVVLTVWALVAAR